MKFRIRIMMWMIGLMALLFGIGGSTLIAISFQDSLKREQSTAGNSYQLLTRTLKVLSEVDMWTDGGDVSESLRELMQSGNVVWSGCRFSSQDQVYYSMGNREEIFLDLSGSVDERHYAMSQTVDGNRHYLQLSGMLQVGQENLYLDVLCDITSIYEMRVRQEHFFYWIFLTLMLLCTFFTYLIAWLLTRPLTRLSSATREIASGNYASRSDIRTADEIGMLSKDFDDMAEKVEQSFREIRQSMERQEAFMGSFAHELKTPMTSVIGYADLIRSQTLTGEEIREAADYIFSEGKRLESLSLQLLDIFMTDRQELCLAVMDPGEQMEAFAGHLAPIYREFGIRIRTDCERGECLLEPNLFETLLVNLTDNSRKAMENGGVILLACRMTEDGCLIICRDNGSGIPREAIPRLSEAFYRVDPSRSRAKGGAGLGLTLCSRIAEAHGGSLQIASMEGAGTTVVVRLRGGRR